MSVRFKSQPEGCYQLKLTDIAYLEPFCLCRGTLTAGVAVFKQPKNYVATNDTAPPSGQAFVNSSEAPFASLWQRQDLAWKRDKEKKEKEKQHSKAKRGAASKLSEPSSKRRNTGARFESTS